MAKNPFTPEEQAQMNAFIEAARLRHIAEFATKFPEPRPELPANGALPEGMTLEDLC